MNKINNMVLVIIQIILVGVVQSDDVQGTSYLSLYESKVIKFVFLVVGMVLVVIDGHLTNGHLLALAK
jgi:hypothetical protein